VLDDGEGVARARQTMQYLERLRHVQSRCQLVEQVERAPGGFAQLLRQLDALP